MDAVQDMTHTRADMHVSRPDNDMLEEENAAPMPGAHRTALPEVVQGCQAQSTTSQHQQAHGSDRFASRGACENERETALTGDCDRWYADDRQPRGVWRREDHPGDGTLAGFWRGLRGGPRETHDPGELYRDHVPAGPTGRLRWCGHAVPGRANPGHQGEAR